MDRRNFIRLSTIGATAGIIAPSAVLATSSASTNSMAGGLYYTKDAPGRWSKKVGGHLPNVDFSKTSGGVLIQVVTPHGMEGYKHYIVKHIVMNEKFEFIDEKMFDPMVDKSPISNFNLGDYSGRVHVLSVCNKHDSWLNFADV